MRLDHVTQFAGSDDTTVHSVGVVLSRRNLLALLIKSYAAQSSKTLTINATLKDRDPYYLAVQAETDEKHYAERIEQGNPLGPLAVYTDVAMQIAVDLLNQVEDSLPEDAAFEKSLLERLANQIGYVASNMKHDQIGVV